MPSARELLEQADALMRRNRSALSDDIPVLTESVPAVAEAQVLRGRGAQTRVATPASAPLQQEGDTIPTLTERVETEAPEVEAGEEGEASDWLQRQSGEPSITGEVPDSVLVVPPPEDDVPADADLVFEDSLPVMADANGFEDSMAAAHRVPATEPEEIELAPVGGPAAEEAFDEEFSPAVDDLAGDLDPAEEAALSDAVDDVIADGADESRVADEFAGTDGAVDGAAADRAPVDLGIADDFAIDDEHGLPEELLHLAAESKDVAEGSSSAIAAAEAQERVLAPPGAHTLARAPASIEATASSDAPTSSEVLALNEALEEIEPPPAPASETPSPMSPVTAAAVAAGGAVVAASLPLAAPPSSSAAHVAAPAPAAQPVPAAVDPAIADAARWEGVAEEIRMQVLQRIDIFTDTGLREQLALRLQPIVDRASADLVATINQHVGDLLRAYVAEAIEREIESWRRSH